MVWYFRKSRIHFYVQPLHLTSFIIFSLIFKMQISSFMHSFEASGNVCLGFQLKSFFNERKMLKLKCLLETSKTVFKLKPFFQFSNYSRATSNVWKTSYNARHFCVLFWAFVRTSGQWPPVYNGHICVPRVVIVHRFECIS